MRLPIVLVKNTVRLFTIANTAQMKIICFRYFLFYECHKHPNTAFLVSTKPIPEHLTAELKKMLD